MSPYSCEWNIILNILLPSIDVDSGSAEDDVDTVFELDTDSGKASDGEDIELGSLDLASSLFSDIFDGLLSLSWIKLSFGLTSSTGSL